MIVRARTLPLTLCLAGALAITGCVTDEPAATSADIVERAHSGDIHHVKHVIIVMQENHSFDNYFGVLAFAPGSPYHAARVGDGDGDDDGDDDGDGDRRAGCGRNDHRCVDGLRCTTDA